MPKPQPKSNIIHQQILSGLLANKQTVRAELRGRWVRDKKGNKTWEEKAVDVVIPTLAGNVSAENLERAAKRWAA